MNYPNSGLSGTVTLITILQSTSLPLDNLRQNSFGNLDLCGAFLVKFILTFVFILVIVAVTGKKGNLSLTGLVLCFILVLVHLLGIPLTRTSVNPARSIAPAIFIGSEVISQLWIFTVSPILGGIVREFILNTEK